MRLLLLALVLLAGCGKPSIEDLLPKGGINCKAKITMPTGAVIETTATIVKGGIHLNGPLPVTLLEWREDVDVAVRIYDCKGAP